MASNYVFKAVFWIRIWIRVFSLIRIRVLKVRIRPLINLWYLNDVYYKVLEEPDHKGQC